jgi:hypothetical protein
VHHGIDALDEDLATQRRFFRGRHPSYERILAEVAAGLGGEVGERLAAAWSSRGFAAPYERPLLLLASLRYDALGDAAHPLAGPLLAASEDGISAEAVAAAIARPGIPELLATRHVQTNEVSRAVAWRWPATLAGGRLAIVDVGCSAGLNLVADALPAPWVDARGAPVPVAPREAVVRRLGIDRAPLDPRRDDDAAWLRACVWPGEARRLEMLEAAIVAFRAAPPEIERLDLRDAPARLARLSEEVRVPVLAYQTVVRDYLAAGEREAYVAGMRDWLERSPGCAWIELEQAPSPTRAHPAAIYGHTRGASVLLARCAFHPLELAIEERDVGQLAAALSQGTAPVTSA